ncbi:hypothetical protein PRIPAC_80144 [Pristionchus pacificus]|uniref:G protein-coupled receptor n=1 Tax=Pristionchus pacificus TaxID=54126 RepID=A0A2A6CLI0_PRIPA|nr:hypothetical protein PRIPAC_80144 [Pristionchus pacificus]|eukprot:PDM78960.1 G protein-coupled receptor [Pristionchus pacificus]
MDNFDILSITIEVVIDLSVVTQAVDTISLVIVHSALVPPRRRDCFWITTFRRSLRAGFCCDRCRRLEEFLFNICCGFGFSFALVFDYATAPFNNIYAIKQKILMLMQIQTFVVVTWIGRMNQSVAALAMGLNQATAFLVPTRHARLWNGLLPIIFFVVFQFSLGCTVGVALGTGSMEWARALNGGWLVHISAQKKKRSEKFSLLCVAFATDLRAFFINHFVCTNLTSITLYLLLVFCKSLLRNVMNLSTPTVVSLFLESSDCVAASVVAAAAASMSISLYALVEDSHVIAGFITNILLMYTIVKFSRKSLGSYKEMLLIFAAYDVFLVALHAVLKPRVVVVETTIFGVAADWDNRYITAFYCSCNTVPFVLMIIDFLYRYWCIGRPHLIALFSDWRFAGFLVLIVLFEYFLWYFVCTEVLTGQGPEYGKTLLAEETGRRLGKEIKEGWLVMNYWENDVINWRIFIALMIFNTIMIGCFSIAITFGGLCYYHIYVLRGATHSISANALNMQRKLFLSVCAQTAVPLFFVYIPYLCVLNLPFMNLPVFFWDDACMLLTSCFPAWDGIIVIVLMPDYWKGLLGIIWKKNKTKKITSRETQSIPTVHSISNSRQGHIQQRRMNNASSSVLSNNASSPLEAVSAMKDALVSTDTIYRPMKLYDIIENSHLETPIIELFPVGGMVTNCMLIFAIIRFTTHALGSYKQLLLIFAFYDIFLVSLHAVLKPRVMVVETTIFGVAADWNNRYITSFYCSCNTVPFVLMIIDFLYRYWCIAQPHKISLFANWKFVVGIMIIPVAEYIIWFFVCTEMLTGQGPEEGKDLLRAESFHRIGKEIHEGWLVMNYWENDELNVRVVVALMIFNAIMIGCFTAAVVLGSMTYYHIHVLRGNSISAHSLHMQRKLFISVCAQTAVPLVLVYIPYICVLNLPVLNLPVFFWDDACMLLTSCFPAWDAVIVIGLMPDYWKGLLGIVCKRNKRPQKEVLSIPTGPVAPSRNSRRHSQCGMNNFTSTLLENSTSLLEAVSIMEAFHDVGASTTTSSKGMKLYDIIEDSHLVGGMITNCMLIFAIIRYTTHALGSYKQLLLIFAFYDVFLVSLHFFLKPRVMVVETTIFGVAADWDNRYITSFYCSCNTVPFVLMIIDFLYRYWCIAQPHKISLFTNGKFIIGIMLIPLAEYILWFFVCTEVLTGQGPEVGKDLLRAESLHRLGKEIHEGWLVMNYWENDELNVRIFIALMIFNAIMIGCFTVAMVLGSMTYYHIHVLRGNSISAHSLHMQRKLFISVCAQTAVPLVLVYIPYICVLNLPVLNLPVFFWDDACMLLTSCFPAWDAVIVIVLMPDYWKGLLGICFKRKHPQRETLSIPSGPTIPTRNSNSR